MGQGISDHFDHLAIELDVATLDVDQHLLAKVGREIADHPRQSHEEILDPLHARAGDRIAHFGDDRRQTLESSVDGHVSLRFAQPTREFVPRQHHVGHGAHHAVQQLDRQANGARSRGRPAQPFSGRGEGWRGTLGTRGERMDQRAVIAPRHFFARFNRCDHLANAIDDAEHGADQRPVGNAAAGADVGKRILGGVAERIKAREFEKAAIALHRVDEAEDGIEPRAIVRRRFPGDDLPAQGFEHFAAFGYEIGNQVIHRRNCPQRCFRARYAGEELTLRYP